MNVIRLAEDVRLRVAEVRHRAFVGEPIAVGEPVCDVLGTKCLRELALPSVEDVDAEHQTLEERVVHTRGLVDANEQRDGAADTEVTEVAVMPNRCRAEAEAVMMLTVLASARIAPRKSLAVVSPMPAFL